MSWLTAVLVTIVLVAWLTDRRMLLAAHAADMERERKDRRELLNRIKPETAQLEPARQVLPVVSTVDLEDDEAYETARLSREEMAFAMFGDAA